MSDKRIIGIGDIVSVCFDRMEAIRNVRVVHCPQDVGDCWKLYSAENDKAYNVQMFGVMERIEVGEK